MTRNTRREFYGEVSKFFIDIAKLVFAGVIFAGILKESVSIVWLLSFGIFAVAICLWIAYRYFKASKKIWYYGIYLYLRRSHFERHRSRHLVAYPGEKN